MPDLTERERRELAVNTFETDLERARDAWINRRVLPYVRCYGTAYAWHAHVLEKMKKREANTHANYVEVFTAVALVVGPAVLGAAPIAAALAVTGTASRKVATRLAGRLSQLKLANEKAAEAALHSFIGGTSTAVKATISGPVKNYLKGQTPASTSPKPHAASGMAFVGGGPPGSTPSTAIQRAWMEQLFYEIPAYLLSHAIWMRDNPKGDHASVEGLRKELDKLRQSEFMKNATGLKPLKSAQLLDIRKRMEKAIWAMWTLLNIRRGTKKVNNYALGYGYAALSQGGSKYANRTIPNTYETITPVPDEVFERLCKLDIQVRPIPKGAGALRYSRENNFPRLILEWAENFVKTAPTTVQPVRDR
ncbi:hypothetical protein [Roseibium album]|uniref:hypothetical protein n=1 Tax=Roseibium album TaxID=311410 RepID=UPI002492CBA8|nr:hypothetical protein [Roseibium album]